MKSIWKMLITAVAFAALILAANSPARAASYNLTDLGGLSLNLFASTGYTAFLPENKAFGINDTGTVVGVLKGKFGTGANPPSQTHVISWNVSSDGKTATANDLGMQPLYPTFPSTKSYGYGINSSGQIVGYTQPQGQSAYYAFLYDPSTSTSTYLGRPTGTKQATATAINDSGQVVGFTGDDSGGPNALRSAFIYNGPGNIVRIPGATVGAVVNGTTITGSSANAINNHGQVTGYSSVGLYDQAFIYDPSATTPFLSLGTLGGATSYGKSINDSGAVVGYSSLSDGVTHAFLYTNKDGMIDLGALGVAGNTSQANAINNAGTIVGASNGHAFVYQNNQMIDLNTLIDPALGFTLTNATGINNLGQIVGYGTLANGEERAFALTPTPIPAALPLFGSGLAVLGFFRRRLLRA
jgi:probable HAF family extracellular repeat protein